MNIEKLSNARGEDLIIYVNKISSAKKMPIVIMFHGFTSKGNNSTNKCLVELLNTLGIATVCVDLSGHGESGGSIEEQTVVKAEKEIQVVFDWVVKQEWVNLDKISILGSSFSGNSSILFASQNRVLNSLVLKSPVTNYYDVRLRQLGEEKMKEWKIEGKIVLEDGTPSNYSFIQDIEDIDTYEKFRDIKCPILVVQGDKDEDIPMEHVDKLKKYIDKSKDSIKIINGANHGYTNKKHFDLMVELIVDFLKINLLENKFETV